MAYGINFWAVLVSAVWSMIVGSIWYGPLFGKLFMKEMGMDQWPAEKREQMKKSTGRLYALQFVGSSVMFFVLSWYVNNDVHQGLTAGLGNAFGVWIGFVVPLTLSNTLWGGKKTLFWLNIGNMLVTLLGAGVIMGLWH